MLVSIPSTGTQRFALAAVWPGSGLPHWNWWTGQWQVEETPTCLLPMAYDAAQGVARARIPDALTPAAEVEVQLVALTEDGRRGTTEGVEVLLPPAPAPAAPAPTSPDLATLPDPIRPTR